MLTTAYAVIGAQFGDEGKGLMVDYLANQLGGSRAVVVRSNGGSQAGHTVQTPEGQRHVFSHFGSGTFTGARTHFSRFMIVNPIKYRSERMKLLGMGVRAPRASADPNAMVSLPFDALINQAVEIHRSNTRHGSCGQGIGETVERNEHDEGFPLTVGDLAGVTFDELRNIRDSWVGPRLKALGVAVVPHPYRDLLADDAILENFLVEVKSFLSTCEIVRDEDVTGLGTVIFEAAQGLALDADMGAFPFVTRSNTGLKNIAALSRLAGITEITTHYMTRVYTTRHGAGPLQYERDIDTEIEVCDPTNVHNDWQGTLRFAPLDFNVLMKRIRTDLDGVTDLLIHPQLVITCLDQIRDKVSIYHGRTASQIPLDGVSTALRKWGCNFPLWESWGPTRDDIAIDESMETGKPIAASA